MWALAESSTGNLSRNQMYTGKEGGRQENGLSHRVVIDLVRYLSGSNLLLPDGSDGGVLYAPSSVTEVVEKNLLLLPRHQCPQQLCRCQGHLSRRDSATAPDVRDVPRRRGNRIDR